MSTESLIIANDNDAMQFLKNALNSEYDNKIVQLDFQSWPKLEINIKGDRYDSTLTAAMMKALIEFQVHLNRVYGTILYNKDGRSIKDDEREAIEILFKIEKGSSNLIADLSGFFSELGKNAVEKLTGKQIVTIVLGAAFLWTASTCQENYLS